MQYLKLLVGLKRHVAKETMQQQNASFKGRVFWRIINAITQLCF
jgi:hypothetical protein